jgi:hypothetical protein
MIEASRDGMLRGRRVSDAPPSSSISRITGWALRVVASCGGHHHYVEVAANRPRSASEGSTEGSIRSAPWSRRKST